MDTTRARTVNSEPTPSARGAGSIRPARPPAAPRVVRTAAADTAQSTAATARKVTVRPAAATGAAAALATAAMAAATARRVPGMVHTVGTAQAKEGKAAPVVTVRKAA